MTNEKISATFSREKVAGNLLLSAYRKLSIRDKELLNIYLEDISRKIMAIKSDRARPGTPTPQTIHGRTRRAGTNTPVWAHRRAVNKPQGPR